MLFARRLAALRLVVLAAVLASTVLTVDHVRPGREFCPLAEACAAAAQSELGSFGGMPTSVLGLTAFAALFGLTLLPVRHARRILMPACFVAALTGMGLIAYQAMHLDAFCPLCLVVDIAAIVAGYLALTWPSLPLFRTGRDFAIEAPSSRTAWGLGLLVVMMAPFAWPRAEQPGWEELPQAADALFEEAAEATPVLVADAPTPEAAPDAVEPAEAVVPAGEIVVTPPPPLLGDGAADVVLSSPPAGMVETAEALASVTVEEPTGEAPTPAPSAPIVATPEPAVRMVEYLNAFCTHCRATHKRLEQVIERSDVRLERRRVYTWNDKGYPLWARACAYAATVGRENEMFHELTRARSQRASEVHAAARRAGVDGPAYRRAMAADQPPERLVRDRRIVGKAGLKKLPTFDIGRRRLAGSQSERELFAALRAAARAVRADRTN